MNHSKTARTLTRGIRLFVIATIVVMIQVVPQPAQASPYVVTNTNNSGIGSLRQAITDAYNNPDPDTITFAATTNGNPIILAGVAGDDANASGDLDIMDGGDLTIQGNGPANTIIDGGGIDRVFHVCPGGGCTNSVTFSSVTIRNGNLAIGVGGGIRNQGDTIVDGSVVISNTATYGGGISNLLGTLTVRNGSVIGRAGASNMVTSSGGGIFNDFGGTTTVDDSTVSTNTADKGGGIYNNTGGTTTVDGSTISANIATDGGGIYSAGVLTITDSIIGGAGAANTASVFGGGVYNAIAGTTTVDSSTISANAADRGGGIYNKATLNIQNSTIGGVDAANTATFTGGGIYNYGGPTTVDASTVSANTASLYGGGIHNHGTLNIQNGSTIGGTGAGNTATGQGGGISNWSGKTTVDGSTISANTAEDGGGIWNVDTLIIQNGSTIGGTGAGNEANGEGGGIYNDLGTTRVDGSIISANTATHGGGIYNDNGTTVDACTINANTAESGGGIYTAGGTTRVTDSRILNNTATTNGGGVFNDLNTAGATDVTGSCIVGNSDTSFLNNQAAQQIATLNWWGAVAGPNTSGADTVGGNVDTSSFLPAAILGCTPDLQVTKANDIGGEGKLGTPFNWTLTVRNTGLTDAVFGTGQTILDDDIPAGPTYGVPVAVNFVNVNNGANIDCSIANHTLTCSAGGGGVIIGASGSFDIAFSVIPSDVGALRNPAGICRVDPDGNVGESDEGNNNCPVDTVNVAAWTIYMPLVLRQSP